MDKADRGEPELDTSATDIAAGLFLAAMAAVALLWLIPSTVQSGASVYDVGPAFFPKLTAWVVLVLSLVLSAGKWVRTWRSGTGGSSGRGWSVVFEIIVWTLVAGLTLFGLSKVSFVLTAALLVAFGALAAGYRKWWVIAVLAVGFPVVVDQLVWLVFTVDLP